MKILKHGKTLKKTYRYECPRCGCVFELNHSEYLSAHYANLDSPSLNIVDYDFMYFCPECSRLIIKKNIPKGEIEQ